MFISLIFHSNYPRALQYFWSQRKPKFIYVITNNSTNKTIPSNFYSHKTNTRDVKIIGLFFFIIFSSFCWIQFYFPSILVFNSTQIQFFKVCKHMMRIAWCIAPIGTGYTTCESQKCEDISLATSTHWTLEFQMKQISDQSHV